MMEFSLLRIQIFVSTFLKLIFVFFNQMQITYANNFILIKKTALFTVFKYKKLEIIHFNFINLELEVKIFKKFRMVSQELHY